MSHARQGRFESETSHGIDLAPMLDFVLNLLIFFIITAVFVRDYGVDVARPGAAQVTATTDGAGLRIQLLPDGEIVIDGRSVDVRSVRTNVERHHAQSPKAGVLVLADAAAPTGLVVAVVDQVHQGGVYDVTFATDE